MVQEQIQPSIIMWVLKVSDFLEMELPLPKHEELRAEALLHRRETADYCIFVSHQWISAAHPDPAGDQFSVLQQCLRRICDGSIAVSNDAASQLLGQTKTLSDQQRVKVRHAFLWLDWASIPQVETFESEEAASRQGQEASARTFVYRSESRPARVSTQQEYILSLPSFVQACQVFVALVPPLVHHVTRQKCNHASWITRGWCRTEMFCKMMLGNQDMPIIVVTAADVAQYARPVNWVDCFPHEAEFSYEGDRIVVKDMFEQAVSYQLSWLEHQGDVDLYRYFLARREIMTERCPVTRKLREFLEEFRYGSLKKSRRSIFGPVVPAVLAGDVQLVKALLEARCAMDKPLRAMPEVGIEAGLTAMHLAALQGWRHPEVLQVLLEARGDPNLAARGVPLLACCRTAGDVQMLVDHRADVNGAYWPLHVPVLALASGENTKPSVIAQLLRCRASPNPSPHAGGLGLTSALSMVTVNATSNPHALAVAGLLLEARADVNFRGSPGGVFRALELMSRACLHIGKPRSVLITILAEQSTTPLGFACLLGCTAELVQLYVDAGADVNAKNARGHSPLDLTRSQAVLTILHEAIEPWNPAEWEAPQEFHVQVGRRIDDNL